MGDLISSRIFDCLTCPIFIYNFLLWLALFKYNTTRKCGVTNQPNSPHEHNIMYRYYLKESSNPASFTNL